MTSVWVIVGVAAATLVVGGALVWWLFVRKPKKQSIEFDLGLPTYKVNVAKKTVLSPADVITWTAPVTHHETGKVMGTYQGSFTVTSVGPATSAGAAAPADMLAHGVVQFADGAGSLILFGTVNRTVSLDSSGNITLNTLNSVDVSVVGGTGRYKGAVGDWSSTQIGAGEVHIRTNLVVPRSE